MRLHYYTPAVPHSYCVGVHNGHGFGSLFARIFSKVAVRTAAKAAGVAAKAAAKTAAKTALRVATTTGKKVVKQLAKQGAQVIKETAKGAVKDLTNVAGDFVTQKIAEAQEKALNSNVPAPLVNSLATIATGGVQHLQSKVPKLNSLIDTNVDKAREKIETVAGVERKKKDRRTQNIAWGKSKRFHRVSKARKTVDLNKIIHGAT